MELILNKRSYRADFGWLNNLEKIFSNNFKIKKVVSIALVSEKEIKQYNKVYRAKNKVTDVLSFILDEHEVLGEVVICLDQARRQAKQNKRSLKSELQWLTTHGILHLLGYDHELSEKEDKKQREAEKKILEMLSKKK